jgi:hypothetical protein
MQGKACFNFKVINACLLSEIGTLVNNGAVLFYKTAIASFRDRMIAIRSSASLPCLLPPCLDQLLPGELDRFSCDCNAAGTPAR